MASREAWDSKYRAEGRDAPEFDPFLLEARPHFPTGHGHSSRAADLACGSGRNALCLARWGLDTVAIDYSPEALRRCRERANALGLELKTECLDLETAHVELGDGVFDVVVVFNYLHRPLIPILKQCVKPRGIIAYKTFTVAQLQFGTGPKNPDYLLKPQELGDLFSDFDQIVYREERTCQATASLVARRP